MEAKSTDRKTLQLTDGEQQLGELIYENLFFLKAELKLTNSGQYKIAPVGIFGTSITVTKNGRKQRTCYKNCDRQAEVLPEPLCCC